MLPSPFATASPEANHLLASVFAFVHLIGWAVLVNRGVGPRSSRPVEDLALQRSTRWIVIGAVTVVVFVAVLGPGIGPLADDPRLALTALASVR